MIWRRSGGQSLVEFALVAPILIFLAMAVWDGGGVLREQIVLQQAARDGARVAATAYAPAVLPACTSTTSGSVSDAVLGSAGDLPGLSRTPGYLSVCYPDAQSVQVQITSVHTLFTPVLRWVWGGSQGSLTLHASATFFLPLAPATVVPPPPTPTQTQTPTITPTPTSTPVPPTATPTLTPTSTPTPTPAAVKLGFKVQPSNTVAGASFTPAVQVSVQDALGNTVTTSTALITLAIGANPGGGAITGLVTVPAVGGVATFSNLSINRTGVGYTLIASNASLSPATSAAFNILVGPASKLAFTVQPSNAAVVTNIAPAVQVAVQDASGNTVTSSTALISLAIGANPGGGTLTGPAVAAVSGVATFNTLSINKIGVGYTLIASSGVLGATTSTAFNIQPGAPSKLVFSVQPTNTVAGASIAPAVQVVVQDSLGNTATSSSAPITLAIAAGANPGGGTLSGISTVNATAGVAGFGALSINRPGVGYKLTATSPGLTVTSTGFTIAIGAASRLAFTVQPSDEVAATNLSPNVQVTVQDSSGNTITGSSASISLGIGANPGGGTLSGTATRPASSGVVSFTSMSIDKTGVGYTLVASSAGLTGATSVAFDITPGAATKLAFSVQPTNEQVGVSIAPAGQVSVQDAQGNTVTSSSASISMIVLANPGGGSLGGTTTVSAVSGVATFGNLTISRIGTGYLLRASSAGLGTVTSVSFNITAVPTGTPTPTLTPTPTPTPPPTPTITPIPTVTPTPTMTPTPVQPCVLEPSTQPVPLLQNGFGYWCTVQVSDTSWVLGNWQVNSDPNNQLLIYAGNPFAGQSDPVLQSPTADIGSNYQFGGQLWTATGCLTPGTYTVYFYNFGSQFPASDGAVWIFGC